MTYFAGNARIKTAALFASTFVALSCVIGLAADFVGIAGDFLSEAMIQGPAWLVSPINFLLRPMLKASGGALVYAIVLAPTRSWAVSLAIAGRSETPPSAA